MANLFDKYGITESEVTSMIGLGVLIDLIPQENDINIVVHYERGRSYPVLFGGQPDDFKNLPAHVRDVLATCRVIKIIPVCEGDDHVYLDIIVDPSIKVLYEVTVEDPNHTTDQDSSGDEPVKDPVGDPKEPEGSDDQYAKVVNAIAESINNHAIVLARSNDEYDEAIKSEKEIHGFITTNYLFLDSTVITSIGEGIMPDFKVDPFIEYMRRLGILHGGRIRKDKEYFDLDGYYILYRLNPSRLGVNNEIINGVNFTNQNCNPNDYYNITRRFVNWAADNKPVTVTTKEFSSIFNIGLVKSRKVMDYMVSIGIMHPADMRCKPRSVDIDKVNAYKNYFKFYSRCRFCSHYSGSATDCGVDACKATGVMVGADEEHVAPESLCAHIVIDESRVNKFNEVNKIPAP